DIFWFSLFHELGHILLQDRNSVFLETDNEEYSLNEKEADQYASDVLIPPSGYARFIEKGNFYKDSIVHFADEIQISPGIVVGRLQHDGHIQQEWHNSLRTRYDWK
ncbi:MAG: hypothetical protein C0403_16205, partial [Desulfobacterium sp.]|nr:hypothetical protein [Desulfobacterium sp.]